MSKLFMLLAMIIYRIDFLSPCFLVSLIILIMKRVSLKIQCSSKRVVDLKSILFLLKKAWIRLTAYSLSFISRINRLLYLASIISLSIVIDETLKVYLSILQFASAWTAISFAIFFSLCTPNSFMMGLSHYVLELVTGLF